LALATLPETPHISEMVHVIRNIPWRLIKAAQIPMPGITLTPGGESRPMTSEELEKQRAREEAYKATLQKIPDKENTKTDPWANMRGSPPASSETKRQRQ
jgi:hypothetical protein